MACRPSATIERTMPVANLQSYRTIGVRVHSSAFAAQGQTMRMEAAVLDRLRKKCQFEQVLRADQGRADILIDLNIAATARGGDTGWNSSTASVDTLLVLTDGQDGELLGTARIRGKSSGMIINNAPPENEAIDIVAKTVADLLAKSGCTGARVAKAPIVDPGPGPGPGSGSATDPGPGSGSGSPPDESKRAEADGLNDKGKERLYADDVPGALALFQQANRLLPDPRYGFNICLALGTQSQWDAALAACRDARAMNPSAALAAKIDRRMEALAKRE
jgi:tetratricopeptide (TPR) repeat protein